MDHKPKYLVIRADGTPLPEGMPFFVLLGQDICADDAMRGYWYACIARGFKNTSPFMTRLGQHIKEMHDWRPKKRPD